MAEPIQSRTVPYARDFFVQRSGRMGIASLLAASGDPAPGRRKSAQVSSQASMVIPPGIRPFRVCSPFKVGKEGATELL